MDRVIGHLHPLSIILDQIVEFSRQYGFVIAEGDEIETESYNFDQLNIDADHPARDDHDTFYLQDGRLLRTHTSPMQLHYLQENKPPVRLLVPGRVYRNESTDSSHNHTFYQVEGLVIDKEVSLTQLTTYLSDLIDHLFGRKMSVRFRPSYFPFVEPGLELDILDKHGKYLEVLGAGMVHPNVLKNMSLDPEIYQGFAFGVGLERLVNLISGVDDVRQYFESDYRFLAQF